MLKVRDLGFDYPDKPLFDQVSFEVKEGMLLHLQGTNGSGKTTLLKLLAGLLFPEQGQVSYQKESIWEDIVGFQQNIRYIGHKSGISPQLTVEENILYGLNPIDSSILLDNALVQFDLNKQRHTLCGVLSAGQRRKSALLRLVLSKAKIWLLDEPLVALDNHSVSVLVEYMMRHLKDNGIIVMTSHQFVPLPGIYYQEYRL